MVPDPMCGPRPEKGPVYPRTDGRVKWNRAPLGEPYEHAEIADQGPLGEPTGVEPVPEAIRIGCPVHAGVRCPVGCPHDKPDTKPFAGGGVREDHGDRARFELLWPEGVPFEEQLLTRCAVHMAKGARKYSSRNWESFSDAEALERCQSAALRHIYQWLARLDDGEDHAAAVVFNLLAAENIRRKLIEAEHARYPAKWIRITDDAPPDWSASNPGVQLWPSADTTRD